MLFAVAPAYPRAANSRAAAATSAARVRTARPCDVSRYRFGLRLADFLLCRACGVFVAAYEPGEPGAPGRAVINLACLTDADAFVAAPTAFTAYDDEDVPTRAARRARTWTPATLAER